MRNLSAPMLPLSSGTLPGQISMTNGSAAAADPATTNDKSTMAADTVRCMVEFLRYEVINSYGFAIQLNRSQTSTNPNGLAVNSFSPGAGKVGSCLRLILLRSAFALRVERHLGDFPVLLAFDLVVRLAVLQSFHCFQTGGAAKIFLRRCAD